MKDSVKSNQYPKNLWKTIRNLWFLTNERKPNGLFYLKSHTTRTSRFSNFWPNVTKLGGDLRWVPRKNLSGVSKKFVKIALSKKFQKPLDAAVVEWAVWNFWWLCIVPIGNFYVIMILKSEKFRFSDFFKKRVPSWAISAISRVFCPKLKSFPIFGYI